tara:strand:- start:339 stop:560 length:222 start_codon:yes stop_codon:yes gene_type:complete
MRHEISDYTDLDLTRCINSPHTSTDKKKEALAERLSRNAEKWFDSHVIIDLPKSFGKGAKKKLKDKLIKEIAK